MNNVNYDLSKWSLLFQEITFWILFNMRDIPNLTNDDYIDNYLNLDFMPLTKLAGNQFSELRNLSFNNVRISDCSFAWPKISSIIFNNLYLDNVGIIGLNSKNFVYANTIILNKSILFRCSLVSPNDKLNNVNLIFKRATMLDLLKRLFTGNKYMFSELELVPGTSINSKELYDYYNWYTYYVLNHRGRSKIISLFDLIITKYYTSFFGIFLWSGIFIFSFAIIMWNLDNNGGYFTLNTGTEKHFTTYLYMSMTNYTTLGFGEIVASHWFSYLLVTLEVFIGYYMLAMLVAVSAKREMKY